MDPKVKAIVSLVLGVCAALGPVGAVFTQDGMPKVGSAISGLVSLASLIAAHALPALFGGKAGS